VALQAPGLYSRVRPMLPEFLKFCLIGGIGTVIDLGGAGLLQGQYHYEPLAAKAVSVTIATIFTYFGSRFWTFKHRENQSVGREATLFFVLNVAGLLIAEAVIGVVIYVMGMRGTLDYNVASVIGSGLGTVFRFYAYRKWVFLAPAQPPAAGEPMPGGRTVPDYPPWEADPAFLAAEAAAHVPVGSPAYSSPWAPATVYREPAPAAYREATPAWNSAPAPARMQTAQAPARVQVQTAQAPARVQVQTPAPARVRPGAPRTSGRHRKS
jgi:putative flippase GtrA